MDKLQNLPQYCAKLRIEINDFTILEIKSDQDGFFATSTVKFGSVINLVEAGKNNPIFLYNRL